MGFTDTMYWNVANEVIEKIFLEKYIVDESKPWYESLNKFIVKEWNIIHDRPYDETDVRYELFNDDDEESIISDAFDILLEKMEVDEDDYEDHSEDVSWDRFDEIISSYLYHEYYDLNNEKQKKNTS